jgi:hypothetical protein
MRPENMNILKKGDVILIAAVILLIAGGFAVTSFFRTDSSGKIAVIKQENKVIQKIDLNAVKSTQIITVGGKYKETILVEKGRIRFEEANCPDLVCVRTGWLSRQGDIAVCLPNRTIIKIEGEGSKVDGVAY